MVLKETDCTAANKYCDYHHHLLIIIIIPFVIYMIFLNSESELFHIFQTLQGMFFGIPAVELPG